MSNELTKIEKQFFETFEIEPIKKCFNGDCIAKEEIGYDSNICDDKCVYIDRQYPQITDHILLELICILGSIFISVQDKETLKDHILNQCIMNKDVIKHQVQELFRED